eukprot:Tbor_TRINITY_DN6147_c3_g1::TRINITY_DN6147_c3_g1_i16::g.22126::m.22126
MPKSTVSLSGTPYSMCGVYNSSVSLMSCADVSLYPHGLHQYSLLCAQKRWYSTDGKNKHIPHITEVNMSINNAETSAPTGLESGKRSRSGNISSDISEDSVNRLRELMAALQAIVCIKEISEEDKDKLREMVEIENVDTYGT